MLAVVKLFITADLEMPSLLLAFGNQRPMGKACQQESARAVLAPNLDREMSESAVVSLLENGVVIIDVPQESSPLLARE